MMGRRNCTVCGGPVKNHPPPGYGPGRCAVLEQEEGAQGIPTAQVQPPQPPTAQNVSTAEVLLKMLEQNRDDREREREERSRIAEKEREERNRLADKEREERIRSENRAHK